MRRFMVVLGVALALGTGPAHAQFPGPGASNPTAITSSGAFGKTSLYPSTVTVSGGTGFLFRINVKLHGVTTTYPGDLDVMLESPNGKKTLLMSDAGGTDDLNGVTINIADNSSTLMPAGGALTAPDYKPTNNASTCASGSGGDDQFLDDPFPATTASFTDLNRAQINGTWKLWVMDDCNGDPVQINGGWTLQLATNPDFGVGIPGAGTAGPAAVYPIDIPVSGRGSVVNKVRATLDGVNHTQSNDLDILLVGPTGASTLLMSDVGQGLLENIDDEIVFDDSGPPLPSTTLGSSNGSGTFRPTNYDSAADTFPAPAPSGPYGAALAAFNGTNPNGTWKLYAFDDVGGDVGGLQKVTLDITATTPTGQTVTTTQTVRPSSQNARDATAPVVVVTPGTRRALKDVLRAGSFRISVKTNEPAKISGQALVSAPLAKTLKLPSNGKAFTSAKKKAAKTAIVATGRASAGKAETVRLKLKLTRKARRALARRGKSVSLQLRTRVTDNSGNRRLLKSTLKLKR